MYFCRYAKSKKLDEPVHSGRAGWLPANPLRGISPLQSNGQALEPCPGVLASPVWVCCLRVEITVTKIVPFYALNYAQSHDTP